MKLVKSYHSPEKFFTLLGEECFHFLHGGPVGYLFANLGKFGQFENALVIKYIGWPIFFTLWPNDDFGTLLQVKGLYNVARYLETNGAKPT